jgi:hypothetical protein
MQPPTGLDTSLRAARRRAAGETGEGFSMAIRSLSRRPGLAFALGVLVVALGLLAIPMSFERTVGYDVALTLGGGNLTEAGVAEIAQGLSQTLGATGATVTGSMEGDRVTWVLAASAKGDARAAATAFARELSALGYAASVAATPRRETVSGNVYAYAMSRVIQINMDGKSATQLESEIRDRLAAAGVTGADVSVTDLGGDARAIRIHSHSADGAAHQDIPELVLTKDGQPIEAGCAVKVMKRKDDAGLVSLVVTVSADGKSTTAEIANASSMSDAAIAAEIESRLLGAGIDAVVKVEGDRITVEKRKK